MISDREGQDSGPRGGLVTTDSYPVNRNPYTLVFPCSRSKLRADSSRALAPLSPGLWGISKIPFTIEDLLLHLPFRYEDRLNPRSLAESRRAKPPPSSRKSACGPVAHPPYAPLRNDRRPGHHLREVHVVPWRLSRRPLQLGAAGRGLRQGGTLPFRPRPQNDPAAI